MKSLLGLWIVCWAWSLPAGNWYEALRPGATKAEILKAAGRPTSSVAGTDTYKQTQGRIECKYDGGVLQSLVYYDTPDGAVSWTLYSAEGELKDSDLAERRAFLKGTNFKIIPRFSGKRIYTHKYDARCYEVDGKFIVVEPIITIAAGTGYFADKAARVLLCRPDGTEEVLYRASDHWDALKPDGLAEGEVQRRLLTLKQSGARLLGTPMRESLGKADSHMGSGVDYRLFYVTDGLIVAICGHPGEVIESLSIWEPGLTNHLTVDEWLARAQPTAPPLNAAPPHR